MNPEEFRAIMERLGAAFERELTPALLDAYWCALEDLDRDMLAAAAAATIREAKFFPRPSELRDRAGAGGTPAARAMAAWLIVRDALGRFGTYASVSFQDPVIHAAIRSSGGWEALGRAEDDAVSPWARKRFEDAYVAWSRLEIPDDVAAPLVGIVERETTVNGFRSMAVPCAELREIACPYLRPETKRLVAGGGSTTAGRGDR